MSGFDYSKWDNLDCSDSESEGENDGGPQVTRLDESSSVTFGGGGDSITVAQSPSVPSSSPSPASTSFPTPTPTQSPAAAASKPSTTNGSSFTYNWAESDGTQSPLHWSQTRDEVVLNLGLPGGVKSNQITVCGTFLRWNERQTAVGTTKSSIEVKVSLPDRPHDLLLQHRLAHSVFLGEEDDDPNVELITPDWEIVAVGGTRYLRVVLGKAVPMAGVSVWWSRLFEKGSCDGEREDVDVETMEGRGNRKKGEKAATMKEAWDEAHKMFVEKMKQKQK